MKFHTEFYDGKQDQQNLAKEKTEETKNKLRQLQDLAGSTRILFQVVDVPPTQFMVIGNTIYEFILDATSNKSDIHDADVKEDRRTCEKFIQTFEILKKIC